MQIVSCVRGAAQRAPRRKAVRHPRSCRGARTRLEQREVRVDSHA
jgi:hypothetical protein